MGGHRLPQTWGKESGLCFCNLPEYESACFLFGVCMCGGAWGGWAVTACMRSHLPHSLRVLQFYCSGFVLFHLVRMTEPKLAA